MALAQFFFISGLMFVRRLDRAIRENPQFWFGTAGETFGPLLWQRGRAASSVATVTHGRSNPSSQRWKLAAVAAAGSLGELIRRRRSAKKPSPPPPPPPPMTTQSSPGQIADLQQAYGADMAPSAGAPGSGPGESS